MTEPTMPEAIATAIEIRAIDEPQRLATIRVCRWAETSTLARPEGERFLAGSCTRTIGAKRDRVPFTDRHTNGTGQLEERAKVGRPIQWHDGPDELSAVVRFYDSPEGWRVFNRARDGELDGASVGFVPVEERVGADGARELVEVSLHHVMLLCRADGDVPAYDAPRVLETRTSATEAARLLAVKYDPAIADRGYSAADLARMAGLGLDR
jgi:hypothetical protein